MFENIGIRFTRIDGPDDGVSGSKLDYLISSTLPKTLKQLSLSVKTMESGQTLFREWSKNQQPCPRFEIFGVESYYSYGLYQTAEGKTYLYAVNVQKPVSFVELTSEGIIFPKGHCGTCCTQVMSNEPRAKENGVYYHETVACASRGKCGRCGYPVMIFHPREKDPSGEFYLHLRKRDCVQVPYREFPEPDKV